MAAGRPSGSARSEVLRGVLTLAIEVARHGPTDRPSDVPAPLRPVLRMAKLGPRALAAADRAGDDEAFRARIAEVIGAEGLTPAEQLWLERPEGWEDDLTALVDDHTEATEEGAARRRLEREGRRRRRAEQERDQAVAELAQVRTEVAEGRRRVEGARAAVTEAERAAATAEAERAGAVRALKHQEAISARAHEQLRVLRAERDRVPAAPASGPASATRALAPAASSTTADRSAIEAPETESPEPPKTESLATESPATEPPATEPPRPTEEVESPLDRSALAAAVARSAEGADQLAAALAALARLVGGDPKPSDEAEATAATPTTTAVPREPARSTRHRRAPRRAPRRRPAPLPGGVHDDSTAAAHHLVRLPGAVLLVDGYNASKATWGDRPIDEQRLVLVTALDGLEARVGVDTTVVFDGVEEALVGSPSRRVRVRFTAADIEADDVILDLVDQLPDGRPVLVASDDGRVRHGARERGANLLTVAQLRSLLGAGGGLS